MAHKIVIMLLHANPDTPEALGSPFFQAAAAAAMDLEVEIYFAARATQLLRQGVAQALYPGASGEKSLYQFMQEAHRAGARFYACGGAMEEHGLTGTNVIPELDEIRGGGAFIGAAIEDGVVTLTY